MVVSLDCVCVGLLGGGRTVGCCYMHWSKKLHVFVRVVICICQSSHVHLDVSLDCVCVGLWGGGQTDGCPAHNAMKAIQARRPTTKMQYMCVRTFAENWHLLIENSSYAYKYYVATYLYGVLSKRWEWTKIPDICQFKYTTALIRPIKIHQNSGKFATK